MFDDVVCISFSVFLADFIHTSQLAKCISDLCSGLQVAMATAAKAKLLLRELKTVKADFAFAKERCAQLEEENKILRENRDKGDHRADDDLVFIFFFHG